MLYLKRKEGRFHAFEAIFLGGCDVNMEVAFAALFLTSAGRKLNRPMFTTTAPSEPKKMNYSRLFTSRNF